MLCLLLAVGAVSASTLVFSKDPVQLLTVLGFHEFSEERYADAERAFSQAAELRQEASSYHNAGVAARKQGKLDEARQHFLDAIDAEDNALSQYALGLLAYERQDYQETVDRLQNALALEPENVNARFDLAVTLVEHFRLFEEHGEIPASALVELEAAAFHYSKVAELYPDFPHAAKNAEIVESVLENYHGQRE